MSDFLDSLEARMPAEVEHRARSFDRRRVGRAIDRALAPPPRRSIRKRVWIGLAAAAVLVALSAAAAVSHVRTQHEAPRVEKTMIAEPAKTASAVPTFEPAMSVDDLPIDLPIAAPPKVLDTAPEQKESPAQLFTRANHLRQSGDVDGAIAVYRTLEQRFGTSNEAVIAHVSLGRVLLDRDPNGALAEYDRYLATDGETALREEALVGRAQAFGKLNRKEDEKRAWQALIAEHPDSLHATRAKERIAALP
jgi:TolA-binding protein